MRAQRIDARWSACAERGARRDVRQHARHRQRAMLPFAIGERRVRRSSTIPTRGTRAARCPPSTNTSAIDRGDDSDRARPGDRLIAVPASPDAPTSRSCRRHIGGRFALVILGMIVTEDVQDAVNDEPRDLLAHRDVRAARALSRATSGADVDVADDRITRRGAGEAERDHVRRPAMTEVLSFEPRHRAPIDQRDRDERVRTALAAQRRARDRRRRARGSTATRVPFGGHVDVQAHTDANSEVMPPLAAG